jgi:hypothetical protein
VTTGSIPPREASERLGLSTAKLRSYVAHFPELFSESAKESTGRRYTPADLAVFSRVREVGGRIAVLPSEPTRAGRRRQPSAAPQADLPSQLQSIATHLDAIEVRIRLDYLALQDRIEALARGQADLERRLDQLKEKSPKPKRKPRKRRQP